MNLIQGKSNQFLREAILEESLEKTRRYLTLKIGKADVGAVTESGGFTMLHCAALTGNDGYTALDLAIWKGHAGVIDVLRQQGSIAPMKEPESLNGKIILHMGRKSTVVDFEQSTSIHSSSLRALYYEDTKEAKLVNLWAGTDYKIIGFNPHYEELKRLEFVYDEDAQLMGMHGGHSVAGSVANAPQQQALETLLQGQAFIDNDSDSDEENEIEEIVEVHVGPGPLGLLLDANIPDYAVVHGFTEINGEKGPIERHGGIRPGMYIISINETNASIMSLEAVKQYLIKIARKEKVIRFAVFHTSSPRRNRRDTVSSTAPTDTTPTAAAPATPEVAAPPTSTTPAPPAPVATGGFSSRLASIAMAVMENKPKETECVHCGMPATAHQSTNCPYR